MNLWRIWTSCAASIRALNRLRISSAAEFRARRETRDQLTAEVAELRQQMEVRRGEFVETMRNAADVGNKITGQELQLETLLGTIQRSSALTDESNQRLAAAETECQTYFQQAETARTEVANLDQRIAELESQTETRSAVIDDTIRQLNDLRERQTVYLARADVLREFEARLEGVGSGVKQVLAAARDGDPSYVGVRGMVADIVRVTSADMAAMVDIALGERAQHLVVAGQHLFDLLERENIDFPGASDFCDCSRPRPHPPRAGSTWRGNPESSDVPIGLWSPPPNINTCSAGCCAIPGSSIPWGTQFSFIER